MFWRKKNQPTLLYDGDCAFCKHWVGKWKDMTGSRINYEPYQKAYKKFSQVTKKECSSTIHFITKKGKVYTGAHAIFKALSEGKSHRWLLFLYDHVAGFGKISEGLYELVSKNRSKLGGTVGKGCNCGK